MKNIIIAVTILIILIVFGLAMFFIFRPADVILQGEADADDFRISSRVPGRVENVYVKEGDRVDKGQLLISLDAPDLRAKAVQAEAAKRAAAAQQQKAETGVRPEELDTLFSVWQKAVVAERIAHQTNERIQSLFNDGVVSAQQRDEAQAQYDASMKDVNAAKAQYAMAVEGARKEDKLSAEALAQQAAGAVQEVESYLADTILSSPIDGEISNIVAKIGELTGSGFPLLTVTDMTDIYVTFNIREDLMPRFRMGNEFDVSIPALGQGTHRMRVTYIAARGSFANWSATKTTGGFDLKTFEVKMRPIAPVDGLRPGMSVLYTLVD